MKDKYRTLCRGEPSIPLFSRDWWLDAVAGDDGWDVVVLEHGGDVVASLPYVRTTKFGYTLLSQPPLTQTLGPWIKAGKASYAKNLRREKDLMQALIDGLPRYAHFSQRWHHDRTNWLPFFWRGFRQTTHYTYRLPQLSDLDLVWSGIRENIRTDVRKARGRMQIRIVEEPSLEDFLELNRKVFARQNVRMPYGADLVHRIDRAASRMNARKLFMAADPDGNFHAGVYLVWDENSAYYLMGGSDPELRNSGATSLCMWEAIQYAATVTKSFDFEGSMLEPVERFFRGFGAVQTPYSKVTHTPSHLLSLGIWLNERRRMRP